MLTMSRCVSSGALLRQEVVNMKIRLHAALGKVRALAMIAGSSLIASHGLAASVIAVNDTAELRRAVEDCPDGCTIQVEMGTHP